MPCKLFHRVQSAGTIGAQVLIAAILTVET
jgi:hypothetical protein